MSIKKVDVPVHNLVTGSNTTTVSPPDGVIAIIGLTVNPNSSTFTSAHGIAGIDVVPGGDANAARPLTITAFCFFKGTKSAIGYMPVSFSDRIRVGITVGQSTSQYSTTVTFLVDTAGNPASLQSPAVPFACENNDNGVLVQNTATSAANTAQTLTAGTAGNSDTVSVVSAWFYTSAGTATGNFGISDGTTRVDIDTTAAVASYQFNVGAKGSQHEANINLANGYQVVIGAAGVGNTTTAFLIYRARLIR